MQVGSISRSDRRYRSDGGSWPHTTVYKNNFSLPALELLSDLLKITRLELLLGLLIQIVFFLANQHERTI